jgi:hypothetical protein
MSSSEITSLLLFQQAQWCTDVLSETTIPIYGLSCNSQKLLPQPVLLKGGEVFVLFFSLLKYILKQNKRPYWKNQLHISILM